MDNFPEIQGVEVLNTEADISAIIAEIVLIFIAIALFAATIYILVEVIRDPDYLAGGIVCIILALVSTATLVVCAIVCMKNATTPIYCVDIHENASFLEVNKYCEDIHREDWYWKVKLK